MQTFLQHLPVPVRHVAKSFKVVTIPVLYVENTRTCRFPYQKNIFIRHLYNGRYTQLTCMSEACQALRYNCQFAFHYLQTAYF